MSVVALQLSHSGWVLQHQSRISALHVYHRMALACNTFERLPDGFKEKGHWHTTCAIRPDTMHFAYVHASLGS